MEAAAAGATASEVAINRDRAFVAEQTRLLKTAYDLEDFPISHDQDDDEIVIPTSAVRSALKKLNADLKKNALDHFHPKAQRIVLQQLEGVRQEEGSALVDILETAAPGGYYTSLRLPKRLPAADWSEHKAAYRAQWKEVHRLHDELEAAKAKRKQLLQLQTPLARVDASLKRLDPAALAFEAKAAQKAVLAAANGKRRSSDHPTPEVMSKRARTAQAVQALFPQP